MSQPPLPVRFTECLRPAMEQAVAIATALEGRVPNNPKATEITPAKAALTIADTATQEALLVPLIGDFAGARLEAEEDTPSVGVFTGEDARTRIVIDPIDGTFHFYLHARGPYAVMAGFALDGRYQAALVALPRERLLLRAVRGDGAWLGRIGAAAQPARAASDGRRVLVSHGMPAAVIQVLRDLGYEVGFACGGALAVAPLLPGVCGGVRLAPADGSISTRGRIGLLIAREAGSRIEGATSAPFPDDLDTPAAALLVAADEESARDLRAALAAAA